MKKILIGTVVVLVLGGIVFASLRAGGDDKGVKVYAEPVATRDVSQIVKASGELQPRIQVNISAHVIGKIDKLFVVEGQSIQRGQPFLRLEQEAFIAQRDQLAAQLGSARTNVRQAEISLTDARLKLERARRLQTEGIASREQLEAAQLAENSALLRLEEARQAVQQMQAGLVKVQDDLTKTTVYAPLTGRVIALNAKEGEVVISGTMNNPGSVIGTIADMAQILAEVDVDETEIVNVTVGQEAVLKVDALPGREYRGRVVEIGSSGYNRPAQPDVTFFKVKVLLEDPGPELRARMSVRAEIKTAAHDRALSVPIQAVVERRLADAGKAPAGKGEEANVVFVVENGKAVQRPVETGLSDETHVELTSGVKAGQQVITGPYRVLRDLENGDAVQITQATDEDKKKDSRRDEDSEDEEE
ncbi:MAG TPA: efflux RND transporter periplasmic adaptor subunit [Thermoanaerobaculia bacterium]